jgi:hypothetical protein
MDLSNQITLFAALGGVILGGAITFATEWLFRRNDRRAVARKNFTLCLAETGRIYSELVSLYRSLSGQLPDRFPVLISQSIRPLAANTTKPSLLTAEVLMDVNHADDQIYSDLELLIRRFNSDLGTLERINHEKESFTLRMQRMGLMNPLGEQDIAQVAFPQDDVQSVMELVRIENLYRDFFRALIRDIEKSVELIGRMNANSQRKFQYFVWQPDPPRIEVVAEFTPHEYLRDAPMFNARDLPVEQQ